MASGWLAAVTVNTALADSRHQAMAFAFHAAREAETYAQSGFHGLILENTSDLVALLDTDGVRLYNNPSYYALFGERDLTGTDSFREIHPDDRERVREIFRATVATGVGQRTRYRFLLEDGSIRHIESQGNVVRDAGGQVAQVVVIARDVTDHIQSEQAL